MKIFNSLTHSLDTFVPIKPGKVTIYVCGITPYDTTHLGHAFTYIFFDVLIRYLKFLKVEVMYTQNVTDINDRDNDILKKASEQNISWTELARVWTDRFLQDMQDLNWIAPTNYLFASKNLDSMIDLIQKLIKNKLAYIVNGSVYLGVTNVSDFGKLSGLNKNKMLSKAQDFEEDLENPDKKDPLDITLWRASQNNQPAHIPSFTSPYGFGRPGWHLECSAMAISSLGEQIDIHGGGRDLIFPHHESEIAQSEGAIGKMPFAKYWLHTGAVHFQGQKMSKSLGNLVMVSDLLKKYSANAIRFVLLSHPWSQDWEFKNEELEIAEKFIQQITTPRPGGARNDMAQFKNIMDDNLDTPSALKLMRETNSKEIFDVLGFQD